MLCASSCSSGLRIAWSGFGQSGFLTVNIFKRELKSKIGMGLKEREREELFTLKEEQMSNSFKNKNNPFPAAVIMK